MWILCTVSLVLVNVVDEDYLIGSIVGSMLLGSNDILRLRVGHNQVDAVGWIGGVAGNVGGSGLADTEHTHDDSRRSWQEQYHPVTTLHATLYQGMGYAVSLFVELTEGQRAVLGNKCHHIGNLYGILLYRLVVKFQRNIGLSSTAHSFQKCLLSIRQQRQFTNLPVGIGSNLLQQMTEEFFNMADSVLGIQLAIVCKTELQVASSTVANGNVQVGEVDFL